ncbi:hypothetical protein D9M72_391830 [compost metagenome]
MRLAGAWRSLDRQVRVVEGRDGCRDRVDEAVRAARRLGEGSACHQPRRNPAHQVQCRVLPEDRLSRRLRGSVGKAGGDLVSQQGQRLLQALGGNRLVLSERDGHAVMRLDLPVQPVPDHHGIPAVLVAELQDLGPEPPVTARAVAAGALEPRGQWTVIHPEPFAAFPEVRAGADCAGQLYPALGEPGAYLVPVVEDAGLLDEEDIAVLLVGVRSALAAVKVGPPKGLALTAVVAHGRLHHGDRLNVGLRAAELLTGGAEFCRPVQESPDGEFGTPERGAVAGIRCRPA